MALHDVDGVALRRQAPRQQAAPRRSGVPGRPPPDHFREAVRPPAPGPDAPPVRRRKRLLVEPGDAIRRAARSHAAQTELTCLGFSFRRHCRHNGATKKLQQKKQKLLQRQQLKRRRGLYVNGHAFLIAFVYLRNLRKWSVETMMRVRPAGYAGRPAVAGLRGGAHLPIVWYSILVFGSAVCRTGRFYIKPFMIHLASLCRVSWRRDEPLKLA